MKKKNGIPFQEGLKKILRIMRITAVIVFLLSTQVYAKSFGQVEKINLKMNSNIKEVFEQLEKVSGYRFVLKYDQRILDKQVDVNYTNEKIDRVLDDLLKDTGFTYKVIDRYIAIVPVGELNDFTQQQKSVSGKVTDSSGGPLPGVSIIVKGTVTGTISDTDGKYSLSNVPENATLQFSFIGMRSQEVAVNGKNQINVVLSEESIGIQEVIAVGYGTQTKRDVTGAISHVKTTELEDLPVAQVAQKLQGQIAGVQINQTTGIPGQGMTIRVRGAASVNAGNSPLIVVDGFPISGSINDINPDEIESISVLKDASSASLYGSRAANGVVLVTTKSGEKGKTKVQFSSYKGIQVVPQAGRPDMMNAQEFAQFQKEYREDMAAFKGTPVDIPAEYQNPSEWVGKGTDWYDILLQNAKIESYSLSVSANTDKLKTSAILGYFNQEGVIINSKFDRMSIRLNTEYQINDKIKIGVNLAPSLSNTVTNGTDGALWGGGIIQNAMLTSPLAPYKNADGTLPVIANTSGLFPNPNWYRVAQERTNNEKSLHVLSNAYIDVEFIKNLHFKSSINAELGNKKTNYFIPSTSGYIFDPPPRRTEASVTTDSYFSWLSENTLTYANTFAEKHNFDFLAGYTAQKQTNPYEYMYGTGFPDDMVKTLNAATVYQLDENYNELTLLSYVGRINYNYNKKYYLSASIRRDGSSRFGVNNRWGNFPSVSAGWIVSDEPFFPKTTWLNYFKLRGSYGITGNYNIGNYMYYAAVTNTNYVFDNNLSSGRSTTSLGNSELGWETTKGIDFGFDFGLLKDRISITYDYYGKTTTGMLYSVLVPQSSGFNNIWTNIGEFKFWGHEIGIISKNLTGKLKWTTNFNISIPKNKVIHLGTQDAPIGGQYDNPNITQVGSAIGMLHGFVFDGIYKNQAEFDAAPHHATSAVGTVRYKDVSGPDGKPDGVIDNFDTTIIGDPNPDFLFGITNTLSYGDFDFSMIISGSYGNDIMTRTFEYAQNLDAVFNVTKDVANRWRSPENPGDGLHPTTNTGTPLARYDNSRWVSDASYLTIKNITLGYTLPFRNTSYFERIRIYGSIQQALVLTKYEGANPEVSINGSSVLESGLDFTAYPVPRTFTFGLNINF
ncbi:MAG TPA: TonB-dependent receptor [Prolixibacteraceae bacterium]|nr:TonB-dependent receptor [Prolixibacteraceae bacterium]